MLFRLRSKYMGLVTSFKTKTLIQKKGGWAEKSPRNEVANKASSVYITMLQKFEKEEVN